MVVATVNDRGGVVTIQNRVRRILAGAGLTGADNGDDTNTLSVVTDGSTLEISADAVQIKNSGVVEAKIASGAVTEGKLGLTDVTTANSAAGQHGFLKKLSTVASEVMNGAGNWVGIGTIAVSSLKKHGGSALIGDVELTEGSNVTITPSGQQLIIAATVVGSGAVDSVNVTGDTPMVGAIVIAAGTGISVSQDDVHTVTVTNTAGTSSDGWVDDSGNTWTYASASTFTLSGDRTASFRKGTRLRFTQTTVKYGVVASAVFSSGTTTVTIIVNTSYVLANAAISVNSYSNEVRPSGYPNSFTWAPAATGFSPAPTVNVAEFSVIGNTIWLYFDVSGTSNATTFTFTMPVAPLHALVWSAGYGTNATGTLATPPVLLTVAASTTGTLYKTNDLTAWTNTGNKRVIIIAPYLF